MSDVLDKPLPTEPAPSSRQDLVIPPRQSNWPVVIGGVASGMAGFGLVFGLGIGRSRHPAADHARPVAMAVAEQGGPDLAGYQADDVSRARSESVEDLLPPPGRPSENRWASPPLDDQADASGPPAASRFARANAGPDGRYAARTVSHDDPPSDHELEPRMSRFSSPDLPPPDLAPATEPLAEHPNPAADQETVAPSSAVRAELDHDSANEVGADPIPTDLPEPAAATAETDQPVAAPGQPEAASSEGPVVSRSAGPAGSLPEGTGAGVGADDEPNGALLQQLAVPPAAAGVDESQDEPATAIETPPTAAVPVAVAPAGQWREPSATATQPSVNPFAPAAPAPLVAGHSNPAFPAPLASRVDRDTIAPTSLAAGIAAGSKAVEPPPVTLPFAAAPPLGPAPLSEFGRPAAAPVETAEELPAGSSTGQGVPGPLQLEGIQTPQVAVEKRGPKEIQVGKPARYEILVRNVGSATAHDVTLRDAVPRGTSLIATTPPASPRAEGPGSAGDLIWTLGVLPPGGEVRVLMELMPEEEGEIGSIASVNFRADATLRSRSTKPALAINCPEPDPVRIGRDMQVTLTVTNPGSGTATGVVLEAFLPESVSHRAGGELEFDVGQLRPGESKTIDLVLGTRGPGLQPARLIARADGGLEEILQVPLEVTAPTLELAIDMPARRFLQRPATCRIAMVNAGTASARSVELAAQLPPGMKFVRANHAGWHDERTHRVLWNLEELPSGETGSVEAVVMPVQPGPQRITAAARSSDGPSAQVAHLCNVEGLAALSFQVVDSEDPIEVDGLTEYVIRVSNDGTKAATGVRVAATLLGDLEPVEATGPGGHRVENLAVEFEPLAKLGPGEEAVYRVRARGHRAGDQRVQVQLVSEDHPTPITKEEITSVYDDR